MWDKPQALSLIANGLYALAGLLVVYGVIYVVMHLPVFPLREIRIGGELKHVTREQVQAVVKQELRGNFFTIDLEASRRAFEKLPWVRGASVRRHWPDRLEVVLEEHMPLARWGSAGLVNVYGEVFEAAYDGTLPMFYGPAGSAAEVTAQYEAFRRELRLAGREPSVVALSARHAWRVRLDDGLTLELGRDNVAQRLGKFVAAYAQTVGRMGRVDYADLRYGNGFAVRQVANAAGGEPRG
jgi:cell division protein FtsQ